MNLSTTPLLIYTGTNNLGETKTITFNEEKGILLRLLEPLKNNVEYKTTINYYIEE